MVPWLRICFIASVWAAAALPAWACGPFLYDNADLDRFSFLDPGILRTDEWNLFLAYASPGFGQPDAPDGDSGEGPSIQPVIQAHRLSETAENLTNLVYEYEPGEDPVSVAANEAWWTSYFQTVRQRTVAPDDLKALLEGPDRPSWLAPADRAYLSLLDGPADDPAGLTRALAGAANPLYPLGLRHRFAFWAVRAQALAGDPAALATFRRFCPGPADDLPLARAQGWAASVALGSDPARARDLWLDLLVRWPALRAQTFSSLMALDPGAWQGASRPEALLAQAFLAGRDFSPETLGALARAEGAAGRDGAWTETLLYAMAEQIEQEAGVFALFGLVDPQEASPSGLFTELIDQAVALADQGVVQGTRTWWLLSSYLCLYDGDPGRAGQLLARARAVRAANPTQEAQTAWIGALVQMADERGRDWSPEVQNQVWAALSWGRTLNALGHNRGLYHSVAVLAAQKFLARGHDVEAALAFGLVQKGPWDNPYSVTAGAGFWAEGWTSNTSVTLLYDALLTDQDLDDWQALVTDPGARALRGPLTQHLAAQSFLKGPDLVWWKAHRALRRGDGAGALALLKTLGPGGNPSSEVFPGRQFSYSLDLDPLHPLSARGLRTVRPAALAAVMTRVEAEARLHPSSRTLLAQGEFWLSLQMSGLPLVFSQPPKLISFVNGNLEYYGYDGRDLGRSLAVVGDFPLGRPGRSDAWARRLDEFYTNEFSTLGKARAAFEAILARHEDPDAEVRALLFLQLIDRNRFDALGAARYDAVPLAQTFRTTCEDFREARA